MSISLTSTPYLVKSINRKTTAAMFKNLRVGDTIILSIVVERIGTSRGRSYAPQITIRNIKTGEKTQKTFNEIPDLLSAFELEKSV